MPELLNTYLFHWQPDRALWISGHTLTRDARCSGIYVGLAIGVLYQAMLRLKSHKLPSGGFLLIQAMLFLPLFYDVYTVAYGLRAPSNDMKYLTGLAFGETLSLYLYTALLTLLRPGRQVWGMKDSARYFAPCLALIAAAYYLKEWDTLLAFGALESLSIAGFLSLAGILVYGTYLATRGLAYKKAS